ncbi:MAG: hypothetical protein D6761_05555 [Candidatus Dadabacteria bacterium]|nr:MAG: hypothetical protein D6761_05555 [Candidatus Dadabacteria bacterium]
MDPVVARLADRFLHHPVWVSAATSIAEGASSQVFFSHLDSEWHLLRREGRSLLIEGPSPDPDFGFCFTPASIERIFSVPDDAHIADFAIELFECITSEDPETKIDFRVHAPFSQLLKRGYVKLLLRGGPRVMQYAARHGVRTLSDLRRLLKEARSEDPVKVLKDIQAR